MINVVINYGPYILSVVLAVVLFIFVLLQVSSLKKTFLRLEAQLSSLETKISAKESALREEIRKTGEEKDLKISQLRDDLRTTLNSFLESTDKKLAEKAADQKSQIEALSARIIALANQIAQKPEPKKEAPKAEPDNQVSAAHEKAKRLARLIVSEILLYNQAAVEEGIRNNTFMKVLAHDIQEARTLYAQRVPEEIRKGNTYLEQAFSELITRKKKELGIT